MDWWEVGGQRYEGTSDLLARASLDAEGRPATYHYQTAADRRAGRADNIAGAAALGVGAGAIGGYGLFFGRSVLMNMLGQSAYLPILPVLGLVAAGAVAGGAIGAAIGARRPAEADHSVSGTLRADRQPDGTEKPVFDKAKAQDQPVDLAEYAKAEAAPPADVKTAPWWLDSLKGAAAGAAAGGLSIFGFGLGQVGVVGSGAWVGRSASGGRLLGTAAGGAAGLGIVGGTIAAGYGAGVPGLAAAAGAVTVGGALLGPVILPKLREAKAEEARFGKQWWNH